MTGFDLIAPHLPVLTVVVPLIAGFLTPIIGWIDRRLPWYWVMLAMFVVLLIAGNNLVTVINSGTPIHYKLGGWDPPFGIEYVIDLLNGFVCLIIAFIAFMVSIYSKESVKKEVPGKTTPFYSVFLLLITGLMGMTITGDIFNFYVFLEISSLTAYALIAMGDRGDGVVASFNYLIMGTVAASFILLGIGYLYAVTGTLNMADMQSLLPDIYDNTVVLAALAFFMVGFSIKVGLFPLHAWLPDAYTHAPSTASALIAGLMTKVGVYAMIRFMFGVFTPAFVIDVNMTEILTWAAALAIIVGSVLAIAQSDIKRMLAYSSISQIGYILLGFGLVNVIGITGGLLHIMNHAFMKCALFLVAGAVFYKTDIRNIYQFQGLGKKMPVTTTVFLIAALSMIGVPGTVGFTSKWYLALGSIEANQWIFVVVILVSSLLNIVYFWRIFDNIWFGHPHEIENIKRDEAPLTMLVPMVILGILCVYFGFFSGAPIEHIFEPLAKTLLGLGGVP